MRNNVGTLTNQRLGSIGLLARVIPSGGPDNADLNVGIDALSAERIGIDALKHFRNRQRGNIAEDIGLGGCTRELARKITGFIKARGIVGHVGRSLIARSVLKLHIREFLGDLENRVHVAKRSGEDELIALLSQITQHALGIRIFGNILNGCHLDLVTELRFNRAAGNVMLSRPAFFIGRAHIHESDFQRLLRSCWSSNGLSGLSRLRRFSLLTAGRERQGGSTSECELESKALVHLR